MNNQKMSAFETVGWTLLAVTAILVAHLISNGGGS